MTNHDRKTVLLGAGGHAGVVLEAMEAAGQRLPVAIVDANPQLAGTTVYGIPVAGDDDCLADLIREAELDAFVMGIGSVADSTVRRKVFRMGVARLRHALTVVHPTAIVSPYATVGAGTQLLTRAVVNRSAAIGENCIINTGAIVEHDCRLAAHVHVAPGAILCGGVQVGEGSHIGCGATVLQSVSIGAGAVIAAGAVVKHDVDGGTVVSGSPARVRRRQKAA